MRGAGSSMQETCKRVRRKPRNLLEPTQRPSNRIVCSARSSVARAFAQMTPADDARLEERLGIGSLAPKAAARRS